MKRICTAVLSLCLSAPLLVSLAGCAADAAADRQDDDKTHRDAGARDAGASKEKEKPKDKDKKKDGDKDKKKDGDKGKGSGTTDPKGSSSTDALPRGYR